MVTVSESQGKERMMLNFYRSDPSFSLSIPYQSSTYVKIDGARAHLTMIPNREVKESTLISQTVSEYASGWQKSLILILMKPDEKCLFWNTNISSINSPKVAKEKFLGENVHLLPRYGVI